MGKSKEKNYFEILRQLQQNSNGFISGAYEVNFLQDDCLTVCVIRHSKHLDEIYTGVAVLHPGENFDAAIGRHKAFKKALKCERVSRYEPKGLDYGSINCPKVTISNMIIFDQNTLPVSQLQKDYWKRYGDMEK